MIPFHHPLLLILVLVDHLTAEQLLIPIERTAKHTFTDSFSFGLKRQLVEPCTTVGSFEVCPLLVIIRHKGCTKAAAWFGIAFSNMPSSAVATRLACL